MFFFQLKKKKKPLLMNLWPLETTALKMRLNLEMWQDTKNTDVKQKILTT